MAQQWSVSKTCLGSTVDVENARDLGHNGVSMNIDLWGRFVKNEKKKK